MKLQTESIKGIRLSDTGNGPCFEIVFKDGSRAILSNKGGDGLPTETDCILGTYNEHDDMADYFEMEI